MSTLKKGAATKKSYALKKAFSLIEYIGWHDKRNQPAALALVLFLGILIFGNLALAPPVPNIYTILHTKPDLPWTLSQSKNKKINTLTPYTPLSSQGELARQQILNDPEERIHKDFKVPKQLKSRVSFWFDIYTKYDSYSHVIHHSKYPWIVFDVVHTEEILKGRGHRWTKYHKSKRAVAKRVSKIKRSLERLAKRGSYKNLRGLEKKLYTQLKQVRGKRKHVFALASRQIRSQLGQKDFFLAGLANSTKYLPYIEAEFKKQNLPQELARLPLVESSFNEKAESRVGASGIWQIMPKTAKEHIRVTDYIDERNSPFKSTIVAAKVLKQYKRKLKFWPLTVTAYNHGIGSMQRAVRSTRSHHLHRIISKSKRLGFASKNFYTSFLAALHAQKYQNEIFNNKDLNRKPLIKKEVVRLTKKIRAKELLKALKLPRAEILSYNLDIKSALKHNSYLPKNFELFLPKGHTYKLVIHQIEQQQTKGARQQFTFNIAR